MAFPIHRWDAVQFGSSTVPVPVAYILPSNELLAFAARTQGTIQVMLTGTSFPYGGRQLEAALVSSADVPNCRPHFFNKTQLYVLVLNSDWYGYPDVLGTCTVMGLRSPKDAAPASSPGNAPTDKKKELKKEGLQMSSGKQQLSTKGISTPAVVVILAAIVLLFLLSIFLNRDD